MGLSDEERISKLYAGIAEMVKVVREAGKPEYPWEDDFSEMERLVGGLWHALLGGKSNGMYWLFGGDADAAVTDSPKGPWSVAMSRHFAACRSEMAAKKQERAEREHDFDPFDGFLDLPSLLGHAGGAHKAVYETYRLTEFISYALRRYDDKLSKGLSDLSRIVSDIQGTCHMIFSKDDTFAKAYVLERTLRLIFCGGRGMRPLDAVGKKLVNGLNMHHYVSRPMSRGTLEEIMVVDRQLGKAPSALDRVVAALRLSGSRFHYDHQFEALVKAFGEKSRVRLKAEFDACKSLHEEEQKASSQRYAEDADEAEWSAVHGYDVDDAEEPSAVKAKKGRK